MSLSKKHRTNPRAERMLCSNVGQLTVLKKYRLEEVFRRAMSISKAVSPKKVQMKSHFIGAFLPLKQMNSMS